MGTLVVFGSLGLARFGYTMVLPDMQAGLGIDNAQTGALATANLIGYLTLAVIGGVVAARYGPRVVIAAGLAVEGAGMVLTGLATSFPEAAAWRVLTGMGKWGQQRAGNGAVAVLVRCETPWTGIRDRRGWFSIGAHLCRGNRPSRSVC